MNYKTELKVSRSEEIKVVEKYHIETIRHAANVIFNKMNELYFLSQPLNEQAKQAIFDTQRLADIIVSSFHSENPIGSKVVTFQELK